MSAPCKILEQGGAGLKLWPKNVGGAYQLMMLDPDTKQFTSVETYLFAHGCKGAVAKMLLSNIARVTTAINKSPTAFTKGSPSSGISLVQLLRTADTVTRTGRRNARVHPFSSR